MIAHARQPLFLKLPDKYSCFPQSTSLGGDWTASIRALVRLASVHTRMINYEIILEAEKSGNDEIHAFVEFRT